MTEFTLLMDAIGSNLLPMALLISALGVASGLIFGAMPGLNQGVLMAMTLPLTASMDSLHAQYLLIGMYVGGVSGGLATGILLGIPGTPASVMSTFDGHALARRGEAARALALGVSASLVGGLVSWFILATVAAPLARFAVKFSDFEIASIVFGGLLLIAVAGHGNVLKGLLSGLFGILVALIGFDPVTSDARFTFGFEQLDRGLGLFPVLMGLFAVGSVLTDVIDGDRVSEQIGSRIRDVLLASRQILKHWANALRSALLGSWIGILPGAGANIGAIIAYVVTQKLSDDPKSFGSGREEGIVSAEAGNNATVGGSLVPMLSLGIPGTPADVFLMAALLYHNISLGPLLVRDTPDVFYGIIGTYLLSNLLMFAILLPACVPLAKVARLPKHVLAPIILLCTTIGTYSLNSQIGDVWIMIAFGVVGFVMTRLEIPTAPFVIGLVLAPLFETSLRSALMASDGSFLPFVTRPMSGAILVGSILFAVWPGLVRIWRAFWRTSDA